MTENERVGVRESEWVIFETWLYGCLYYRTSDWSRVVKTPTKERKKKEREGNSLVGLARAGSLRLFRFLPDGVGQEASAVSCHFTLLGVSGGLACMLLLVFTMYKTHGE